MLSRFFFIFAKWKKKCIDNIRPPRLREAHPCPMKKNEVMFEQELQDFEGKNELLLYGYERGLSPVEWNKLDLGSFIDTLFQRGKGLEDCFEEIQSHEYKVWRKQKEAQREEIDYTAYRQFRYNPIIFSKEGKKNVHRVLLKDDIETLQWTAGRKFAIMPPATFVGRNNWNRNARYLYAIAIDLDGVTPEKLEGLFWMMERPKYFLTPNIIVNSGHGLHIYFLLEEPVPLYNEDTWKALTKLKHNLTALMWRPESSTIPKAQTQFQPILQAFRLPGTLTKFGTEITAWECIGVKPYTIEQLNSVLPGSYALTEAEIGSIKGYPYNPDKITLEEAKRRFPEWYQNRVVEKKRVGKTWHVKRAVYDWWRGRLREGHVNLVGHRYWSIMVLFIYAAKCKIPFAEAMEDAMSYLGKFDSLTNTEDNHFTEEDIQAASKAYHDNSCKFPIKKIEALTLFRIDSPSRRNGRTQKEHLLRARVVQQVVDPNWREGNGRPKATPENSQHSQMVQAWRAANPDSNNKSQCARETGLSRPTVRKWWGE